MTAKTLEPIKLAETHESAVPNPEETAVAVVSGIWEQRLIEQRHTYQRSTIHSAVANQQPQEDD